MHSSNSSDLTAGAIHSGCSTAVNKSASTQRSETVGKNWGGADAASRVRWLVERQNVFRWLSQRLTIAVMASTEQRRINEASPAARVLSAAPSIELLLIGSIVFLCNICKQR